MKSALTSVCTRFYDTGIPGNVRLEDVSLSEGKTVDIRYDGNGDKSKCE